MKRFVKYVMLFFITIAVLDFGFGYICSYLNSHAKGGDTRNHYFIANEMTDSVLVFGSSRALHHFNPAILEDSLGETAFNCGLDGNGIVYSYGRLLTVLNRYKPKMIIYDVIPSFDMEADDCSKYLNWQKRWYDIPGVSAIFHDVDPMEDFKMLSNFYRYNMSFIQMAADNVRPLQSISYKGYKPLYGNINYDVTELDATPAEWSYLKLTYFQKFVELCKTNDIELIISFSPWYMANNSLKFSKFIEFAKTNGLKVIDLYSDPDISRKPEYFEDASHLNHAGADVFTSKFAHILNSMND